MDLSQASSYSIGLTGANIGMEIGRSFEAKIEMGLEIRGIEAGEETGAIKPQHCSFDWPPSEAPILLYTNLEPGPVFGGQVKWTRERQIVGKGTDASSTSFLLILCRSIP